MSRVTLAAAALLLAATPALGDVDVAVRVGHGNRWVADAMTPVVVSLRNSGADPVTVRVSLAESTVLGGGATRHTRDVFLAPGANRREVFVVPGPERFQNGPELEVVTRPRVPVHSRGKTASKGQMRIETTARGAGTSGAVPTSARAIGTLFDDRGVLSTRLPEAAPDALLLRNHDLTKVEAVAVDPALLGLAPFVLDGLDALVVMDPDASFCEDPRDLDGLLDWVALGGLLVVSPGNDAGALVSSPIAPHLPATWNRATQSIYSDVVQAIRSEFDAREEFPPPRGQGPLLSLVPKDDAEVGAFLLRPLWVDRDFGQGRIRMLAFDVRKALDLMSGQNELQAVATLLAGRPMPLPSDRLEEYLGYHFGRMDLDGSVASTLRQDAFEPPPLPLVLLGLGLYVLIVGPVDWFVLKRLKKERLTTLTFAGAVAAFTTLAYAASFLVFSSGAVVNRIVFVDLADGGRDGRQLMRVHDLAGFYSPRGADQDLDYTLPAVIMPGRLPGSVSGADVGTSRAAEIRGNDPVGPEAKLLVAFRSQRTVRAFLAGPTGRTLDTEWEPGGRAGALTVTNGLPIDLEDVRLLMPDGAVLRLGSIASGETSDARIRRPGNAPGQAWVNGSQTRLGRDPRPEDVRDMLGLLSRVSPVGVDGRLPTEYAGARIDLDQQIELAKAGIGKGTSLRRSRALLIAYASRAPVPLPGDAADGRTHVVIRKEIELP